jgi:hypothetical protein
VSRAVGSSRKYVPFAAAVLLAAIVVVAERNLEIGSGAVYALAGFFLGLLIVAGPLFAFGHKTLHGGDPVQTQIATVVADDHKDRDPATEHDAAVIGYGLKQGLVVGNYPVCVSTHRAWVVVESGEDSVDPLIHGTPA